MVLQTTILEITALKKKVNHTENKVLKNKDTEKWQ